MKKIITMTIVLLMAVVNYIAADNRVSITDFSISAGETKDVNVLLDNEISYVAFQFDLYLPEGITLAGFEVNRDRVPESTDVSMAKQEDGSFRFLAAAMSMEKIVGSNGNIVTLKLSAKNNISIGNKTGCLRSVKLSKADAIGVTIAEVPFAIKVLEPSTVTARSYSREYGEENPTFEYDVKGGELEGAPIISCEATATSSVGTYPIVISKGSVANYNDSYVNGTLTITKAPLTITAKSYTIKQGAALPAFEMTYAGFKNNEKEDVLTKKPTITCNATSWSDVGRYDITISGATAQNYNFTYKKGTLTITEPDSYTLIYMVDGETYKKYEVPLGKVIVPETEPEKEGYTFSGWSEIPATMPAKDVIVTGSFSINSYKLTYIVDREEYKTCNIEYGSAITAEGKPTKEGYTFSGWSEIPAIMPAKDVIVTGTFTVNKYRLTYMMDGENYKTYELGYGAEIIAEVIPVKEGYTFSGWSEIPAIMPAKDVIVTGTFTINKYRLSYKVGGMTYKAYLVEYGTSITAEEEPQKEGYTFSGWSEIPATMPANAVTIRGSFTVNTYTLTYMVDDETYKTYEVEFGTNIIAEEEPTQEGYSFSGWSIIPETMPAKDVIVTGRFTRGQYRLVYMVNDETYKTINIDYGIAIVPEEEPSREGYTFSGWSEIPATMPAGDVTITGTFSVNKYKLIYKVDDEEYKTYDVEYGTIITVESEPIKEGYNFSGWSVIPDVMPAKDVIITGLFTKGEYQLTYVVDGFIYKIIRMNYGDEILVENIPEKEGYSFSGWSEIPATMPAKDVIVTGTCIINNYKLTYVVDGALYKSVQMGYGAAIPAEAEPTMEGYSFSGWGEIPATMPAKDVTVTGSFNIKSYKLIYMVDDEAYKTIDVEYGAGITPEAEPIKEGYTFSGWSLIPEIMPAHDVTITGAFTFVDAIEGVLADDGEYQIYTLDGKPIETLQKGVNIIKYEDGTSKIVVVR